MPKKTVRTLKKTVHTLKKTMEAALDRLEEAFLLYRKELEECARRQRPADGLFGIGHSMKDDLCHDRFDERVGEAVRAICALSPGPGEAERAVRRLLCPGGDAPWPLSAQWMLRAAERHALSLIPFLEREAAGAILKEYTARYRPWDRLPAQKQVCAALKERS